MSAAAAAANGNSSFRFVLFFIGFITVFVCICMYDHYCYAHFEALSLDSSTKSTHYPCPTPLAPAPFIAACLKEHCPSALCSVSAQRGLTVWGVAQAGRQPRGSCKWCRHCTLFCGLSGRRGSWGEEGVGVWRLPLCWPC